MPFWPVVASIPLCIIRKLLILKERREGDSCSSLLFQFCKLSYRFQIAMVPTVATAAVDHCTLLHAGKPQSFCVSPPQDGAVTRSQDLAPTETQGDRGIESLQHTTSWLPIPESIGAGCTGRIGPRMPPRMVAVTVIGDV